MNLAFGFILKSTEDGGFRFSLENKTLLDRSKLMCPKADLTKLNDVFIKTDVMESCNREGSNTKRKFHKLANLTVFEALLKDLPLGCKDAVLPEPLLNDHTINCLTYEEKTGQLYKDTCAFFVCLLSICKALNDWKKKIQKLSNYSSPK